MRPVDEAKPINPRRRTSSTELHCIPRTDNGRRTAGLQEWSVADRELGDRARVRREPEYKAQDVESVAGARLRW